MHFVPAVGGFEAEAQANFEMGLSLMASWMKPAPSSERQPSGVARERR